MTLSNIKTQTVGCRRKTTDRLHAITTRVGQPAGIGNTTRVGQMGIGWVPTGNGYTTNVGRNKPVDNGRKFGRKDHRSSGYF